MNSDNLDKNTPQRHPKYWHRDGSVVFHVEKYLYCVHLSILERLSPVFNDIFSIPPPLALATSVEQTKPIEGSIENPLFLEQVKSDEFDNFLLWIYRIDWKPPPQPEVVYIDLLKLCQRWQIDEGVTFAIHHLEQLPLIRTARRLELARMYSIFQWVKPALRDLIYGDFLWITLTDEECCQIGFPVYKIVAKAKHVMERERRSLAFVRPRLGFDIDWVCDNHEACGTAWKAFWEAKMVIRILHPINPMPLDEIADCVGKHLNCSELMEMSYLCKIAMVEQLRENKIVDAILDAACKAVITYFTSL